MVEEAVAKALESSKSTSTGSTTHILGNIEHRLDIMLQTMVQLKPQLILALCTSMNRQLDG